MTEINTVTVTEIVNVLHPIDTNSSLNWCNEKTGVPTHELILRVNGQSNACFDGNELRMTQGDIKYLPEGQGKSSHKIWGNTGDCINIFFHSDIPLSGGPFVLACNDFDEYKRLFEKIEDLWIKKDTGYQYAAMSVLYKILHLIQTSQDDTKVKNPNYAKIKPAMDYINTNFRRSDVDIELAADMCNISYSYFRILFAECVGITPAKYIINKRIDYAKDLLAMHRYSVEEVSRMVGFKDVYYFSHVFKKLEGIAPSRYIQK